MLSKPHAALFLAGHGSSRNSESSAPTRAHAGTLRQRGAFGEVACAFFKEEPRLRDALKLLVSEEIFVVPNCISEGWFTRQIIPRELALDGAVTTRDGRTIKYCAPVGNHPRMTDVLLQRATEILPDAARAETSLLVVGHGTERDENSSAAVGKQVALLRARGGFGEVVGAFMDEAPFVADWEKLTTKRRVVVVPFFIADGQHTFEDIPRLLGVAGDPFAGAHGLRGRELFYAHAVGTHPMMADVILDQVAAFA